MQKVIIWTAAILAALILLPFAIGSRDKVYHVAILLPTAHSSLTEIERGFRESLGKNYHCRTFNAMGSRNMMRSEIREIEEGAFDLVFTVGASATQMTQEALSCLRKPVPIVFAAVDRPEGLNLGPQVTGVREYRDHQLQLDLLEALEPSVERVLLVYDPRGYGLEQDREALERIFRYKGIELLTVEVAHGDELEEKVAESIMHADLVVVLKDNTVVSHLDQLSMLCHVRGIPLMASDLPSVSRGASYGFGVEEIDFGREASKKAIAILEEKVKPADLPITQLSDYNLRSNKQVALDAERFPQVSFQRV